MPLDKIQAWSQVQEHLLHTSPAEDQRVQFLVLGGKISTRYFSHMQLQRFGRTGEVGKYIDPKLADPPVWSLPASRDPGECRICLVSLQSAPQVLDKAEEGVLSCLSCGVGNDALLGCRCLSGSPSHSRAVTRPSFSCFPASASSVLPVNMTRQKLAGWE